jgi:hypothetical protein
MTVEVIVALRALAPSRKVEVPGVLLMPKVVAEELAVATDPSALRAEVSARLEAGEMPDATGLIAQVSST